MRRLIVLTLLLSACSPYDNTDNPQSGERSGLHLFTDHLTGCQYLSRPGAFSFPIGEALPNDEPRPPYRKIARVSCSVGCEQWFGRGSSMIWLIQEKGTSGDMRTTGPKERETALENVVETY